MFDADFAASLQSALGNKLTLADSTIVSGLGASLALTYGCRNRGAHNVAAVPLTPQQFDALVDRINGTLCLTVETLY
jgi:hypothetical protein